MNDGFADHRHARLAVYRRTGAHASQYLPQAKELDPRADGHRYGKLIAGSRRRRRDALPNRGRRELVRLLEHEAQGCSRPGQGNLVACQ